jgi:hypothetical protein
MPAPCLAPMQLVRTCSLGSGAGCIRPELHALASGPLHMMLSPQCYAGCCLGKEVPNRAVCRAHEDSERRSYGATSGVATCRGRVPRTSPPDGGSANHSKQIATGPMAAKLSLHQSVRGVWRQNRLSLA